MTIAEQARLLRRPVLVRVGDCWRVVRWYEPWGLWIDTIEGDPLPDDDIYGLGELTPGVVWSQILDN